MSAESSCCPPGSHGYLDYSSYQPTGVKKTLDDGLELYTAGQPGKNALLMIPDVWGWGGGRTRALADQFASQGRYVVVPKLQCPPFDGGTDGDALPKDFDFGARMGEGMGFIKTFPWDVLQPKLASVLGHLAEVGATNVAAIGFCWGVWVVCKTAKAFPGRLSCAAWPHPAVTQLEQGAWGGSETEVVSHCTFPCLVMPAVNDPDTYREGGAAFSVLKANNAATTCLDFPTEQHGFMSRGDASNADTKAAIDRALTATIAFFQANSSQ